MNEGREAFGLRPETIVHPRRRLLPTRQLNVSRVIVLMGQVDLLSSPNGNKSTKRLEFFHIVQLPVNDFT